MDVVRVGTDRLEISETLVGFVAEAHLAARANYVWLLSVCFIPLIAQPLTEVRREAVRLHNLKHMALVDVRKVSTNWRRVVVDEICIDGGRVTKETALDRILPRFHLLLCLHLLL